MKEKKQNQKQTKGTTHDIFEKKKFKLTHIDHAECFAAVVTDEIGILLDVIEGASGVFLFNFRGKTPLLWFLLCLRDCFLMRCPLSADSPEFQLFGMLQKFPTYKRSKYKSQATILNFVCHFYKL